MRVEEGTLTIEQTLKGAKITFLTRDFTEVEQLNQSVGKKPLDAKIKPVRQKRSLTANSYYYFLIGQLRRVLGTSQTETHNMILAEYGVIYEDQFVLLPAEVEYLKEEIHYRPIPNKIVEKNGKTWQAYWLVKPSHLYDTSEFSSLVDGLISECKECGIETLPKHELERLEGDGR